MTGYVGNESFLESISQVIKTIKDENPGALYHCDPVMGDNGKLYVPKELVPVYRNQIIPIADVITPNQFELELLTDIKINSESDAIKALEALHEIGIETVVITSSNLADSDSHLVTYASSRANGRTQRIKLLVPKLKAIFTGSGDLFAALFMAWFTKTNKDLKTTCERTLSTLWSVLNRTYNYAIQQTGGVESYSNIELRLIQSRADLENPNITIKAIDLK
ncbi:unnamed protein product [Medioppia subpectinata]|nr:unnamed protein product [Medioppia subpectinata]CAG2117906.1 unnamed protein product [Medioppia subpectinata]